MRLSPGRATAAGLLIAVAADTAATPRCQSPAAADPVAELIQRIRAAQRSPAAPAELQAFRGHLTLIPNDTEMHRFEVPGRFTYSDPRWVKFEPDLNQNLAGTTTKARMFDGSKVREVFLDDTYEELTSKETESTRQEMLRYVRLAQQLRSFFYADTILVRLQEPKLEAGSYAPPGHRGEPIPAQVVRGRLDDFPMYYLRHEDDARPVEVTIWIHGESGLPLAVEAQRTPPDAFQPIREVVTLDDYARFDGVMLPTKLAHFLRAPNGDRKLKFRVQLAQVELNPSLTRADFQPPPGLKQRFGGK